MAPTEILAEQHFLKLPALVRAASDIEGGLAAATQGQGPRQFPGAHRRRGAMVVGTHALFQDEVRFARLALVVIDEPAPLRRAAAPGAAHKGVDGRLAHTS